MYMKMCVCVPACVLLEKTDIYPILKEIQTPKR